MPSNFILVTFLVIFAGDCIKVEGGNDDDFGNYLNMRMNSYSAWLADNRLDPSPVTNASMTDTSNGIRLDCQISNHYLLGHSKIGDYNTTCASDFAGKSFLMGRIVVGLYEFHGNFDCNGLLSKYYYPELSENLEFKGQGKFIVTTNLSSEMLIMNNVGITLDYKLDLTNSWLQYALLAIQKFYRVKGAWSEPAISEKYLEDVEKAFARIYHQHALVYDNRLEFPSGRLLERYMQEVAQNVDLTEILNEDELPDPYVPTSRPSTTTTTKPSTTTTTTEETPTGGPTTTEENPTASPTTTEETPTGDPTTTEDTSTKGQNAAGRILIHSVWFAVLESALVLLFTLPFTLCFG